MEGKLKGDGNNGVQKIQDPAIRQMVDDLHESNGAGSLTEEEEANLHTKSSPAELTKMGRGTTSLQ